MIYKGRILFSKFIPRKTCSQEGNTGTDSAMKPMLAILAVAALLATTKAGNFLEYTKRDMATLYPPNVDMSERSVEFRNMMGTPDSAFFLFDLDTNPDKNVVRLRQNLVPSDKRKSCKGNSFYFEIDGEKVHAMVESLDMTVERRDRSISAVQFIFTFYSRASDMWVFKVPVLQMTEAARKSGKPLEQWGQEEQVGVDAPIKVDIPRLGNMWTNEDQSQDDGMDVNIAVLKTLLSYGIIESDLPSYLDDEPYTMHCYMTRPLLVPQTYMQCCVPFFHLTLASIKDNQKKRATSEGAQSSSRSKRRKDV